MSGRVQDVRMWVGGPQRTNALELSGCDEGGKFLIEIIPIDARMM